MSTHLERRAFLGAAGAGLLMLPGRSGLAAASERIGVLANDRVPAFLIHGDDDKVVPLKENSAEFVAKYRAAGAAEMVTLIVAKGQGHNFWEGFFRCRPLIEFAIDRAHAGALPIPLKQGAAKPASAKALLRALASSPRTADNSLIKTLHTQEPELIHEHAP